MSEPKLSVNKLGEYMTATPSRRRQIIRNQQKDPFVVGRYKDAREVITGYLSNAIDEDRAKAIVEECFEFQGTDFQNQDKRLSAEAIHNFLDLSDEVEVEGFNVEPCGSNAQGASEIQGVRITMRPDALLRDIESGDVVGCVKLHFSKSAPLDDKACEYAATAMRFHLEHELGNSGIIPEKCYLVEIPTGKVCEAPKAFKRRMKDIEAACEEIRGKLECLIDNVFTSAVSCRRKSILWRLLYSIDFILLPVHPPQVKSDTLPASSPC